jgi:hypothetical protein
VEIRHAQQPHSNATKGCKTNEHHDGIDWRILGAPSPAIDTPQPKGQFLRLCCNLFTQSCISTTKAAGASLTDLLHQAHDFPHVEQQSHKQPQVACQRLTSQGALIYMTHPLTGTCCLQTGVGMYPHVNKQQRKQIQRGSAAAFRVMTPSWLPRQAGLG